ncbi:MAG: hypothetical protein HQK89_15075 [Nitrospirae bacterium]|nr:hypothetical protein [Nitrospirota bacterium]
MGNRISLVIGDVKLKAELNDTATASAFKSLLPMELQMSRWGEEYYGDCGIETDLSSDARELMEVGELAIWPIGNALCIFFGPTPVSTGNEPRAASAVNPIGRILDDTGVLKKLGSAIKTKISLI